MRSISGFFQKVDVGPQLVLISSFVEAFHPNSQEPDLGRDHGLSTKCQDKWSLIHQGPWACMVGPKDLEQLIYPVAFGLVYLGSEPLKNGSVHHLHLSIQLGLASGCEVVLDGELGVKVSDGLVVKLLIIVCDYSVGESIPTDNQLSKEFFNFVLGNMC